MIKLIAKNGLTLPKTNGYITDAVYKKIKKDLVVMNPVYLSCLEYGKKPVYKNSSGKYVAIQKMLTFMKEYNDRLELPRGYSYRLSEILGQEIELEHLYCEDVRNLIYNKLNVDLFDYQSEAVDKLISKPCGILSSPAASGKTVMGIDITVKLGLKTLWIVHLDRLMKQAIETLLKFTDCREEDVGIISEGNYNVGNVFTSAIIDTAKKYNNQLSKENFGLVIIDETHHAPARKMYDVLMKLSPQYLYGLSATPYRDDGLDDIMKYMIGPITEVKRDSVVKANKIVTPEVQIIYTNLMIQLLPDASFSDSIITNDHRNNIILYEIIKEIIHGNVCLVLSDRVAHGQLLYNKLSKIYPYIKMITGVTKKKEVDDVIQKLKKREITILISTYQFLAEGVDLPILNRLFFTTPSESRRRCEQGVGRIQRIYTKDKTAKLYDFADSNWGTQRKLKARLEVYKELGCNVTFKKSNV